MAQATLLSADHPFDSRPQRLIVRSDAWAATWAAMLVRAGASGVGLLRGCAAPTAREWLLERLQVVDRPPLGNDRLPLDDWLALAAVDRPEALATESLIERFGRLRPRPSQVAILVAVCRSDRRRWNGLVFHRRECQPLDEIVVVGPGMLRLRQAPDDGQRSAGDALRWSRTAGSLGADVLRRLRESTVTLIGAGRNGAAIALQLAALGIGRLRMIDPDILGLENLDAMPGLTPAQVGRPKVTALAEALAAARPDLGLALLTADATDGRADAFLSERSDLLVTCVDRDAPRVLAAASARNSLTVHLDIATNVQRGAEQGLSIAGDARLFLPGAGCAACVPAMANLETAILDVQAPAGSLPRLARPAWNRERAGSLATINAMTVAAGVQMWLDLVAGELRTSAWQRFSWRRGRGLQSDFAAVGPAPSCRFCRERK